MSASPRHVGFANNIPDLNSYNGPIGQPLPKAPAPIFIMGVSPKVATAKITGIVQKVPRALPTIPHNPTVIYALNRVLKGVCAPVITRAATACSAPMAAVHR